MPLNFTYTLSNPSKKHTKQLLLPMRPETENLPHLPKATRPIISEEVTKYTQVHLASKPAALSIKQNLFAITPLPLQRFLLNFSYNSYIIYLKKSDTLRPQRCAVRSHLGHLVYHLLVYSFFLQSLPFPNPRVGETDYFSYTKDTLHTTLKENIFIFLDSAMYAIRL